MSVNIEAVGEHTTKHGGKLWKNKKFLMIAGGVAVLGVVVYFRKKNAAPATDTASFSNYPTPPQDTGSVPSNIGSSTGTYDPTSTTNDPYSADLGKSQAPLMTPTMYQTPIANVPAQQLESGVMDKTGVAPGGFETMVGDQYTQQGNNVKVTDSMGGIGTYDTQLHNYSWDYSHETAPGQSTVSSAFASIPSGSHSASTGTLFSKAVDHVSSVTQSQANNVQSRIDALGKTYNDAKAKGDTAAMKTAHDTANQLRSAIGQKSYHDSITDK